MKKSEMIYHLNNIIFDRLMQLHAEYGEIPLVNSTADGISEEVLKFQERVGMLPPPICDCGSSVCYEATVNEWKPEDEEEE